MLFFFFLSRNSHMDLEKKDGRVDTIIQTFDIR